VDWSTQSRFDIFVEPGFTLTWGPGNIDVDAGFVDPDGPDDDPLTWADNDYRLAGGSRCIDAGDNDVVQARVIWTTAGGSASPTSWPCSRPGDPTPATPRTSTATTPSASPTS